LHEAGIEDVTGVGLAEAARAALADTCIRDARRRRATPILPTIVRPVLRSIGGIYPISKFPKPELLKNGCDSSTLFKEWCSYREQEKG
jgi:hypothetical protein